MDPLLAFHRLYIPTTHEKAAASEPSFPLEIKIPVNTNEQNKRTKKTEHKRDLDSRIPALAICSALSIPSPWTDDDEIAASLPHDALGVFVTFRQGHPHPFRVRGCIGHMQSRSSVEAREPRSARVLMKDIREVAVVAMHEDRRSRVFRDSPFLFDEDGDCHVEFLLYDGIQAVDARTGRLSEDGSVFSNSTHGLLMFANGSEHGTTYLRDVFPASKPWEEISSDLADKAGVKHRDNLEFFAYRVSNVRMAPSDFFPLFDDAMCSWIRDKTTTVFPFVPFASSGDEVEYDDEEWVRNCSVLETAWGRHDPETFFEHLQSYRVHGLLKHPQAISFVLRSLRSGTQFASQCVDAIETHVRESSFDTGGERDFVLGELLSGMWMRNKSASKPFSQDALDKLETILCETTVDNPHPKLNDIFRINWDTQALFHSQSKHPSIAACKKRVMENLVAWMPMLARAETSNYHAVAWEALCHALGLRVPGMHDVIIRMLDHVLKEIVPFFAPPDHGSLIRMHRDEPGARVDISVHFINGCRALQAKIDKFETIMNIYRGKAGGKTLSAMPQ